MPLPPLLDRDDDLARLDALFDEEGAALVTLAGPAGVGKTSLALAHLERRAQDVDDGVRRLVCRVAECHDPLALCGQLAHALGVPAPGDVEVGRAAALIAASLAAEPLLLVIDNFEQLAESSAELLVSWLAEAPELNLLVTSRHRLGVAGERVLELAPLRIAEVSEQVEGCPAAQLFLARVRAHSAGFDLVESERDALLTLLQRLDGLPLAIELAASRANVLSIEELARRVTDRFALLRDGQSSLESALEASWALLSEAERSALAQCSVFRGSFTLDGAEAVLRVEGHAVVDLLQRLRDRSLVARGRIGERGQRLSLLQSVRDFAGAHLEDREAVETRHADWCGEIARRVEALVTGPEIATGFRLFVDERENLLAALDRCIARADREAAARGLTIAAGMAATAGYAGGRAELAWRIEALIDLPGADTLDDSARASVLTYAGWELSRGPIAPRAARLAQRAQDAAVASGSLRALCAAERLRAALLCGGGKVEEAVALLEARLSRIGEAPTADDATAAATLHDELADLLRQSGQQVEARRHGERALELLRASGCRLHQVNALLTLGFVHIEHGDLELAESRVTRGLELLGSFSRHASRLRLALQLALARIAHAAGDLERAVESYLPVVRMARAAQMMVMHGYASGSAGTALAERGDLAEACEHLRAALVVVPQIDKHYGAMFRGVLAGIEALRGHTEEARRLQAEAEDALRDHEGPLAIAVAACRALVDLGDGRRTPDAEATERAAARLREIEQLVERAPAQLTLELRLIARLLRTEGLDATPRDADAPTLEVEAAGRWFVPPAGARIGCSRRPIMRRMLVALVQARVRQPGRALGQEELLEAGWPGERMIESAAKRRIQVMLSRMRDLGLRDVIQTTEAGYRIDPQCVVRLRLREVE
ncbi:MAG: AAA family ATPase [Myxococcales bacterium]|nr:AAA family ATPase [Myxococcales bacterium]